MTPDLSALYQRLAARRGKKRAIKPVAHSIVVSAFHMLSRNELYRESGPTTLTPTVVNSLSTRSHVGLNG